MNEIQREQAIAAIEMIVAVGDLIRSSKQIPSGELYALLMGKLNHDNYETIITTLVGAGVVRRENNHMLTWIGPELQPKETV